MSSAERAREDFADFMARMSQLQVRSVDEGRPEIARVATEVLQWYLSGGMKQHDRRQFSMIESAFIAGWYYGAQMPQPAREESP